jgi:hypothetical protein
VCKPIVIVQKLPQSVVSRAPDTAFEELGAGLVFDSTTLSPSRLISQSFQAT